MSLVSRSTNILSTIDEVLFAAPAEQESWLRGVGDLLLDISHLKARTTMEEAKILWTVKSIWEDQGTTEGGQFLAREAIAPWEGSYLTWAKRFTQTSQQEPKDRTVKHKIAVYEAWLVNDSPAFRPEDNTVFIPARSDDGTKIDDTDKWEEHEFDPMEVDYTKLLAARVVANKGQMTPEAWTALADPLTSKRTLDAELRKAQGKGDDEDLSDEDENPSVWLSDAVLYVSYRGETVAFARLLPEELENPLALEAAKGLLATIGVELTPELYRVPDIEVNAPIAVQHEDTVVISRHGSRFVEISDEDELRHVITACRFALDYVDGSYGPDTEDIEPAPMTMPEAISHLTADQTVIDDANGGGW